MKKSIGKRIWENKGVNSMIASYLGISFFYIAFALIVYALMDTASEAEDRIDEDYRQAYWHIVYTCKGGEHNGN